MFSRNRDLKQKGLRPGVEVEDIARELGRNRDLKQKGLRLERGGQRALESWSES